MAIEIKAIPTLEGKDAERFIERADEAERKFKGFDGIENTPAFKAMLSEAILSHSACKSMDARSCLP